MLAEMSHSANLFLHSRPKPSAFMMASRSRSSSLALPTYAGSSSVLKQVWLVGSLAESPPSPCSVEQKSCQIPMFTMLLAGAALLKWLCLNSSLAE